MAESNPEKGRIVRKIKVSVAYVLSFLNFIWFANGILGLGIGVAPILIKLAALVLYTIIGIWCARTIGTGKYVLTAFIGLVLFIAITFIAVS